MIRSTTLGLTLLLAPCAMGQDESEAPATPDLDAGPAVTFTLDSFAAYAFEADTDDGDASVSVFRAGGGVSAGWSATEALDLSFGVSYDYSNYDFEATPDILAPILEDDPFDEFHLVSFSGSGRYQLDTSWSVLLGGFARAGWESGADTADAWTGGGYGAVGFELGETLALGFGVGATTQHEDDPFVFPLITIQWQITERLRLENQRLGARLTYTATDEFDLYARIEYTRREYRLDDHPAIGDGVFRDERLPVGLGAEWRPIGGLSVALEAGAMVFTRIKFFDDDGDRVESTQVDPAAYLLLRLEYTF